MAHMTTVKCKCCKTSFEARTADVKRGWGKYCSKSCKAIKQTQKNGYNPNNWRSSGVSKETYQNYQREHGGTPVFNRRGDYQGFMPGPFSNEGNY